MLSLILPTYNEAENLPILIPKLLDVLKDLPHEIIVVDDDSPDETWKTGHNLAEKYKNVHIIRRIGRRGLSSAVIEGFLASKGSVLAVMDADGQHDMNILPQMYQAVESGADVSIGSRYTEGGSTGQWDERRQLLSKIATNLALFLCRIKVKDPMSGFFAISDSLFQKIQPKLNPKGFKILLDLLVHSPKNITVKEIPYTFSSRQYGESKLTGAVKLEFLEQLYQVAFGKYLPLDFIKFCIVGALGVLVNFSVYFLVSRLLSIGKEVKIMQFSVGVLIATEVAIIFNYYLNNIWTFRENSLHGKNAWIGLLKFNLSCLLGAAANFGVSYYLFADKGFNEFLSVFLGILVATVWNYTVNKLITWK